MENKVIITTSVRSFFFFDENKFPDGKNLIKYEVFVKCKALTVLWCKSIHTKEIVFRMRIHGKCILICEVS